MAKMSGAEAFSSEILAAHPNLDFGTVRAARTKYWNAFKHLSSKSGVLRDDEALLTTFGDKQNDAALFCGWHDYWTIKGALPIAAQVFQVWWYALNEDKLALDADFDAIRAHFPGIATLPRPEQKRRLRRSYEKWRNCKHLLASPLTEPKLV
jgi:hypothetical protein